MAAVKPADNSLCLPLILGPLALIGWGLLHRASPAELLVAGPLGRVSAYFVWAVTLIAVGSILSIFTACKRAFWHLMLHLGAVFGFIWFIAPADDVWRPLPLVAGAVIMTTALVCLFRRRAWRLHSPENCSWSLAGVITILPAVMGLAVGVEVNRNSLLVSLLTYPVYAFCQLTVLLAVPAALMKDVGFSRRQITGVCAALFALAHWPNAAVMLATFVAMLVWCRAYLYGRHLLHLALVMGLAATTFSQFTPDAWTEHMKVGPGLVRRRVLTSLAGNITDDALPPLMQHDQDAGEFLTRIYPLVLERDISAAELATWQNTLRRNLCAAMVYRLVEEIEYQHLVDSGKAHLAPPAAPHWTEASPAWQERIQELSSQEYWLSHGNTLDGFYRGLFADTYQRPFPATARFYISEQLTAHQRRRLVEVLHQYRQRWLKQPFSGISDHDLHWTYS